MVKFFYLLGFIALFAFCSCNSNDKDLYRIMENGLYGFVDSIGNVVIKPQYKYVSRYNSYGYATVISEYSLILEKGKFVIPDTLLHVKYGFIDKNNNLVVDTTHTIDLSLRQIHRLGGARNYKTLADKYAQRKLDFNDFIDGNFIQLRADQHIVQNKKTKLMGFMNVKGDTTITAKYEMCNSFYRGVAVVYTTPNYPLSEPFLLNLNSAILIDSLGKDITNEKYVIIPNFKGVDHSWACRIVADESDNTDLIWMLLDKNGNLCSDTLYCTGVYNANSDVYVWLLNEFDFPFYSFVNSKGDILTDFNHDGFLSLEESYRDVTSFLDTIAGVKVNYGEVPCWTFVNKKFEFISQPFDSVGIFHEEVAAVKEFSEDKINSKWGFVDKHFKEIIPYKYDEVGAFVDGLAYFKLKNIEGYINKKGEVVWSHIIK